jgi:hypothetical protein
MLCDKPQTNAKRKSMIRQSFGNKDYENSGYKYEDREDALRFYDGKELDKK